MAASWAEPMMTMQLSDAQPSDHDRNIVRRLALAVLVLSLLVILGGAFVRAAVAGDGCGDSWPSCHGSAVPSFERYETLVEWTHRLSSGLAFLGALALFLIGRRKLPRGHRARRYTFLTFFFMCTEALIGAALVLLKLVATNASLARAIWVSGHLINTFLLIASLTMTLLTLGTGGSLGARRNPRRNPGTRGRTGAHESDESALPASHASTTGSLTDALGVWHWQRMLAVAAVLAFLPMGVTGAIAALGDTLFPASSLADAIALEFSRSAHFLIRLRILHPLFCWVGATIIALAAVRVGWQEKCWRLGGGVLLLIGGQIAVGFANVLFLTPIWLQLTHLLLADLLFIATMVVAYRLFHGPAETAERTMAQSGASRTAALAKESVAQPFVSN